MTAGIGTGGSLRVGAIQINGSVGAAVRVLARLYDMDNVLVVSGNYTAWSLYLFERGAEDVPIASIIDATPITTVLQSAITIDAKWSKDATGYSFSHLLPPAITALLVSGKTYSLRYDLTHATQGKPSFTASLSV